MIREPARVPADTSGQFKHRITMLEFCSATTIVDLSKEPQGELLRPAANRDCSNSVLYGWSTLSSSIVTLAVNVVVRYGTA